MVKLTTFAMMCKTYRGEPTIDLLWSFLNLGPAGDWLTLSNRGGVDLDKKSLEDKVPLHPEMDPLYDQIATYPCTIQTFPDPILYLAGLKTTWKHSPKRTVIYHWGQGGRNSPSEKSMNNDAPVIGATPLSSVYPSNIVENVADSDDPYYGEDTHTLVGASLPSHLGASKKLKIFGKRKVASGVSGKALPPKVQKVPARATKELRDATDCHWVVAYVTHPSWKRRLREISIE
ncbi:hypothetical protein Tco_0940801 [Tanacetum coccineum]|uniref:Uncharacterized protein n=1 Tax=Tanacetum coccineum TaxID=301880 RepID=A0ABQ5DRL8_9ASTR